MITGSSNPQIKNITALQKKSKARNEQDIFVIEGVKMFSEAPKDRILSVFASESFLELPKHKNLLAGIRYEAVSDKIFKEISDTDTPQGILALIRQYHHTAEDFLQKNKTSQKYPMLLVLEEIQDPGNLGTIIRTAEGAGVTGVIMSRGCVDIYNPKTIRSTMGSVFRVPFMYADDLKKAILMLKNNCNVFAAYLKDGDSSIRYDKCDYTRGTAFVIGNEAKGLSKETAGLADKRIIIPMLGQVESLNAAVAASILMYEGMRQRSSI